MNQKTAKVDTVIFEEPVMELHIRRFRAAKRGVETQEYPFLITDVPDGQVSGGVSQEHYDGYRAGLLSACADIVITTHLEDGRPAVLAVKRSAEKSFGGTWYMQGGAIHNYVSIEDFLRYVVKREVGLEGFKIEALVGLYRTTASDKVADTTALCYVTTVPVNKIRRSVKLDENHEDWKLLTREDLDDLPDDEKYWHPMRCFYRCLETMP